MDADTIKESAQTVAQTLPTGIWILITALSLMVGAVAGFFTRKDRLEQKEKELDETHRKLHDQAKSEAKEIVLEAKDKALKIEEEAKKDEAMRREKLDSLQERLLKKESNMEHQITNNEKIREELEKKRKAIEEIKEKIKALHEEEVKQLEKVTNLKKEDAKEILLERIEKDYSEELAYQIKKKEEEIKETADEEARNIIALAVQKYASEVTMESTITTVDLPNDEMKGRIIGREGRNINAFEQTTGIDVIVDDTPGSILISGFDLMRRYIAKKTLEALIEDGRIHPARIEESFHKVQESTKKLLKKFGEKAVYDTGVAGLPKEIVELIGRLRFRTSYGQNILKHSIETCYIASALAAELGADVTLTKKAGLLHDIGKAIDHEVDGSHAKIGADVARKYNIDEKIINCIEAHHEEVEANSVEALIIQAADAISASRPGARRETLTSYVKRLEELERIARSFEGVDKSYAVQAGREVRVFVRSEEVDDLKTIKLSKDIAGRIERDLSYPGQVKVSVIREMRAVDVAK